MSDFFIVYYDYIEKGSELLSEVLQMEVIWFKVNLSSIKYKFVDNGEIKYKHINIYELAHLCKIWALEHDCELVSSVRSKTRALCDIYSNKYDCKFTHYADSESMSIFKACHWILEEIKEREKE